MALNKQIWLRQIKEGFYPDDSWLVKLVNNDSLVDNNKIHIPSAGIDPKVIVNNTTYPIKCAPRDDEDNELTLDTFATENTIVRRPDALEYSYDKLESVIRQHRSALCRAVISKAAHAIAPQTDTTYTPLVATSGDVKGNRHRLCFDDVLALKERFDDADVPQEKRYLVLNPKHVTDLLREDLKLFKDITNIVDGEPVKFAGFGCFSCSAMPTYSISDKQWAKVPYATATTANFASIAFQADEVFKADGEFYMYARYDDPEERGSIVGFDKRAIVLPIRNKGIGAIISSGAE